MNDRSKLACHFSFHDRSFENLTLSEKNPANVESLVALLNNRGGLYPYARSNYPKAEAFSFLDTVQLFDRTGIQLKTSHQTSAHLTTDANKPEYKSLHETVLRQIQQVQGLSSVSICPIVAIAGLLNAGKTSLLAGFLSNTGRARLLIGSENAAGTHRFVIWLPSSWEQNQAIWSEALKQLTNAFGFEPERLSEDPAVSAQQYNGAMLNQATSLKSSPTNSMDVPLIATDPALDQWGIGLMDCPDIQTGILPLMIPNDTNSNLPVSEQLEMIAARRSSRLWQSLAIASAMIIVAPANAIQEKTISSILETINQNNRGIKKIIAVNRVPRSYTTESITKAIRQSYGAFDLSRIYMAYHFEGPDQLNRIPKAPPNFPAQRLPIFFRIDNSNPNQPPDPIPTDDYLVRIGSQLDRSQLVQDLFNSSLRSCVENCRNAMSSIDSLLKHSRSQLSRLQHTLAMACFDLSTYDTPSRSTEIRLQVSREIINQVAESLERTAPWWAKPGRFFVRTSQQIREQASQITKWVALPSWMTDRAKKLSDSVRSVIRSGKAAHVVSSNRFADSIIKRDLHGDVESIYQTISYINPVATQSTDSYLHFTQWLRERSQGILDRFQAESKTRLDDAVLDSFSNSVWKNMSWSQRLWNGIAPASLVFAPLAAVIMLPIDFGGGTVLVFASMKELFVAGLASLGVAMIQTDSLPKIAESNAALQQLGDLFAISCDALGVPRPWKQSHPEIPIGRTMERIPDSQLGPQHPSEIPPELSWLLSLEIEPTTRSKIEAAMRLTEGEATNGIR